MTFIRLTPIFTGQRGSNYGNLSSIVRKIWSFIRNQSLFPKISLQFESHVYYHALHIPPCWENFPSQYCLPKRNCLLSHLSVIQPSRRQCLAKLPLSQHVQQKWLPFQLIHFSRPIEFVCFGPRNYYCRPSPPFSSASLQPPGQTADFRTKWERCSQSFISQRRRPPPPHHIPLILLWYCFLSHALKSNFKKCMPTRRPLLVKLIPSNKSGVLQSNYRASVLCREHTSGFYFSLHRNFMSLLC